MSDKPSDDVDEEQEPGEEEDFSTGKTLCVLGVIACALLMFALPISRVVLIVDMLTHFTMHFMVVGGALIFGFFMPRWNLTVGTLLAIIGVGLIGYTATHKSDPVIAKAKPGQRKLKVMTFNTWLRNRDWRAVAREIKKQNPDVVAMMEFGREKERILSFLKKEYPFQLNCRKISYCHMAILSRFPFTSKQIRTRWRGPPYVRVAFGKKLGNLNLFAAHTIRPPHYRAHFKQIKALSLAVNQHRGLKIVLGDFNSTPFSTTLNTFANRTKLTRITGIPSWPANFGKLPQVAIDHIFVSPKITVLGAPRLGDNSGSDHFPVIATVGVPIK